MVTVKTIVKQHVLVHKSRLRWNGSCWLHKVPFSEIGSLTHVLLYKEVNGKSAWYSPICMKYPKETKAKKGNGEMVCSKSISRITLGIK